MTLTTPTIPQTIPEDAELPKGKTPIRGVEQAPTHTTSWDLTSTWLVGANEHVRAWWDALGLQTATFAEEAGYKMPAQTEILLLLHSVLLPHMGRYPPIQGPSPLQYRWACPGDASDHPTLILAVDAPGDAKNMSHRTRHHLQATQQILELLASQLPQVNLRWYRHFVEAFNIDHHMDHSSHHRTSKHIDDLRPRTPLTFEFVEAGVIPRVFFYPPAQAQEEAPSLAIFTDAIRPLSETVSLLGFEEFVAFVDNHPVGVTLTPEMLGMDCASASAALYLHAHTLLTSFDSVIAILTLGGRVHGRDTAIMDLWELLCSILRLKHVNRMFSWGDELPAREREDRHEGLRYCFEIMPQKELPEVSVYIPVAGYGRDEDLLVGLEKFLMDREQKPSAEGLSRVVDMLRRGKKADQPVLTHIVCSLQGGILTVTSCMEPGLKNQ